MTRADRLLDRPVTFRRLTGLSPQAFRRLLAELEPAWQQEQARRAARRPRRRRPGAGRRFALPLADRLLLLLLYYRTYVSHAFLAFLFGIDDSTVSRNLRRLEPLLAGIFRIPERKVALTEDEIREAFVDATERPTNRPKRGQKRYYSGKKKRHTLKHQVVVVRKRKQRGRKRQKRRVRIAAVSGASPGSVHDKKVYDRSRLELPEGVTGYGDTGYQGTTLRTPAKKPPKGRLTERQRRGNRRLGQKRVVAEHGIGKMKGWRIAAEKYRNPRRRHTLIFKNVAGLHNRMFS
jgi:DDE superfamily endonuclease/Helix-turn-helix of DDE superfamily endonuclease